MQVHASPLDALSAVLGHAFADAALLEQAVTHRSFVHEAKGMGCLDNERLEFLGDAVLGALAARLLYDRFPDAHEGELTRRRADLVSERTLAAVAKEIGLGAALRLGKGEDRSGGRDKPRLLASALEACLGAVYVDGGVEAAYEVGERLLRSRIDLQKPGAEDYKTRVQEVVQGRGWAAPRYELMSTAGPDHAREFFVGLRVNEEVIAEGGGRSKLEAEQAAAKLALSRLAPQEEAAAVGEDAAETADDAGPGHP